MATVYSKVIKKYDKKLLKPFILSIFQKNENIKNKLELPDFGLELKEAKEKKVDEKPDVLDAKAYKEDDKVDIVEGKNKESNKLDNNIIEKSSNNEKKDNINNKETPVKKNDIDEEFENLENKLNIETSIPEIDDMDKIDEGIATDKEEEININKDDKGENLSVKVEEKIEKESNAKIDVPMIEESRHLEILEAERNKYKKVGYKDGYDKALSEAKEKFLKEYEAKKEDYLENLAASYSDAIGEIKKIRDVLLDLDRNLPKIVLNMVRRIVGLERKINDKIIISVVKSKIEKLKTLEDVKFYVSPEDLDYLKYEFPGYEIESDANIRKGNFRVKTRIGEVIFDIDRMLDDLEEIIYEELKVTESD